MSRPSPAHRARLARRARSFRGFLPSVQPLEARQLMATDVEGDSLASALAVSLTIGNQYRHQAFIGDGSYPAGDVDLYGVAMSAGQYLTTVVEAKNLDEGGSLSSLDTYLKIFDASGNQLAVNDDSTNPYNGVSSTDSTLNFTAPSTATYYIGVTAYGNSNYNPNVAGSGSGGGTGAYRLGLMLAGSAPLAAPTGLSASAAGSTQINLSWSAVANATGYSVERSANGSSGWAEVATLGAGVVAYSDTGLVAGTPYYYRVRASNAGGYSPYSVTANATTLPGAPDGLTATAVSPTQINLGWTNHASNIYYTYVAQSTDGVNWTQIASIYGSGVTSYTATGPFNGSTTYDYRVWTYSSPGGTSAYSPVASVTTPAYPNRPTLNSAAAQSDTSVVLAWTAAAGATGYRVERSGNGGTTWAVAGTTAASVTSFTDTGLSEATSYTYRLFATDATGDSAPSATLAASTQPSAPTGLTVAVVSGGQVNLSWTDHSSSASYYYVEQSPNGSTGWTQIGSASGSTAASYTATGPFAGSTTYYFRVRDYAYTGGYSGYATTLATTQAFPNQPTLNSATAQSDTSVALAWSDVAGESGFLVERSTNNGSTWATAGTVAAGVTTFTDTGLIESTSYTYRVTATNAAGSSASSATRAVSTLPSAPSGLAATAASPTQINLSWTNHSSSAYYYYVEQSPDGVNWTQVGSVYGTTATSYTATGPFNGSTTYSFRVRASSSAGYSAYAPAASVTTPAFPSQPTIGSAVAQSDTTVALSWSDVAGEAGFQVQRQVSGTWTTVGTVAAGVTSFTDAGLHELTSYSYRLLATNSVGTSAPSATASATTLPSAPTGLTASAVAWNQVNLSWTDHSSSAYYYYVEQSANGTTWTQVASIYGSSTNSYTATRAVRRLDDLLLPRSCLQLLRGLLDLRDDLGGHPGVPRRADAEFGGGAVGHSRGVGLVGRGGGGRVPGPAAGERDMGGGGHGVGGGDDVHRNRVA